MSTNFDSHLKQNQSFQSKFKALYNAHGQPKQLDHAFFEALCKSVQSDEKLPVLVEGRQATAVVNSIKQVMEVKLFKTGKDLKAVIQIVPQFGTKSDIIGYSGIFGHVEPGDAFDYHVLAITAEFIFMSMWSKTSDAFVLFLAFEHSDVNSEDGKGFWDVI